MAAPLQESLRTRDLDGRTLFIIDNLFDTAMVRLLHESFSRLPFSLADFDTKETRHVRHWKCDFSPESLEQNPILSPWYRRVRCKAAELSGVAEIPVRRVYCNSVLYGDHQHMHIDSDDGMTALYFANAEWHENWQGETIFYDRHGEAQHAIAPRPGRLVVFAADCLHRAGVPARTCLEPRLTVAFKLGAAPAGSGPS